MEPPHKYRSLACGQSDFVDGKVPLWALYAKVNFDSLESEHGRNADEEAPRADEEKKADEQPATSDLRGPKKERCEETEPEQEQSTVIDCIIVSSSDDEGIW
ncbi:unnamed protein product [Prorocentrum cordatum]|uniref:Uncharacterized protein n=1 Tax=Prorocentrum cordatum TaxID=2364126 RepID=A0ABN9Q2V3_9DINO|nr:unnamed protein product [Polarella glacialis]